MSGVIKQVSLKWTQNNKTSKHTNKSWIHPPDALQSGHVIYTVKFLGCTEVDQAKGIDVVKEGIRKLKFNQQLKKAEGSKVPKVDLVVSVDGVSIQDPKTKVLFHQYPLHLISYCADDKSDKKFFSFIAKEPDSDKHICFVFTSEKLAEDITLTIGQAFDLAYRKFLETTGRDLEVKKQIATLQKRIEVLEEENKDLRKKLKEAEGEHNSALVTKSEKNVEEWFTNGNSFPLHSNINLQHPHSGQLNKENSSPDNVTLPSQDLAGLTLLPPVPPRSDKSNSLIDDVDFDPRGESTRTNGNSHFKQEKRTDLFGAEPFNPDQSNPFGMDDFTATLSNKTEVDNVFEELDKSILEMNDGFSRGLSFGNDDFSQFSLDPRQSGFS